MACGAPLLITLALCLPSETAARDRTEREGAEVANATEQLAGHGIASLPGETVAADPTTGEFAQLAGATAQLAEHGIDLAPVPGGAWPQAVVIELAEGLRHLPERFRRPPDGSRLELSWSSRGMPFGMGDGSEAAPEWSDGVRRFHLYAYEHGKERRASYRLERLGAVAREALWRRRAIVHALVSLHDRREAWSEAKAWRRLNGWLRPFERLLTFSEQSLNKAPWAYSRERGQASSAEDFATFAEEALVPVESLDPSALPAADQVRCQEFSKARVLAEAGLLKPTSEPCETFERWAGLRTLDSFEVLFVAASGRAPESLFGHILLRIVRRDPERVVGPGLTPAVQLVALTGGDLPGPLYAMRGLTGGYPMVLMTVPMMDVTRQMLEYEQRSMRRFRLQLTAAESRRLLERIWEMERRGRLDYRFLHDNCAFAAAFVLNGALEEGREIRLPSGISPLLPAATLDALSEVEAAGGGPLLQAVAGTMPSSRELARWAYSRREQERARLDGPPEPALRAEVRRALEDAESDDGEVRLSAYDALTNLGPRLSPEALFGYLAHSVSLERYVFDSAESAALKAKIGALSGSPPVPSGANEADERAKQFEQESALEDAMAVLDRPQRAQAMLEALPKRPFTEDEQRAVTEAEEAEHRLDRLFAIQARALQQLAVQVDPVAWLNKEREARAAQERALLANALPRSGYGRTTVGGGVTTLGSTIAPLLVLQSAVFSEELGEHRTHGLDAHSELRAFAGRVELVGHGVQPWVRRSEFIAAEYRNVRRDPAPFQGSFTDQLGWGFRGGWSYDSRRSFAQRAFLSAEALAVLDDAPDLSRITTFGLGVHAAAGFDLPAADLIAGPALSFTYRRHLGGSTANALELTAGARSAVVVFRTAWQHEAFAAARLKTLLTVGSFPLVLGIEASAQSVLSAKTRFTWTPSVSIQVEPLGF